MLLDVRSDTTKSIVGVTAVILYLGIVYGSLSLIYWALPLNLSSSQMARIMNGIQFEADNTRYNW